MRQKELRIALVCYGGVSLAVYMHGVTKEVWKLARASAAMHGTRSLETLSSAERIYGKIIDDLRAKNGLSLRILPDILTGASAGGINAIFLAQAIHSGQSLNPLTDLWLENADIDRLVKNERRPINRAFKIWVPPLVEMLLRRPGNAVSESVAPETRSEVREKLARLVKGTWFKPPFSGIGFARLLADAFAAMKSTSSGDPLLPPGHPIDLMVTATDFHGYLQQLRLHSPPLAEESEHRMPIGFSGRTPREGGSDLAHPLEMLLAARSTASFPGAFPPLMLSEIDDLAAERQLAWPNRAAFLERVMPMHVRDGDLGDVALIDGSVLVGRPFGGAIDALQGRPAQREVDRRFVYIDPRPDRFTRKAAREKREVGFFAAIFGSLSTIPREQPIRDNLETIAEQSREAARLGRIVRSLRPQVELEVDRLFGRTYFLNRPTPRRLANWRAKAQQVAAEGAGYAFNSYAQAKLGGILEALARTIHASAPELRLPDADPIALRLRFHLEANGLDSLSDEKGGATPAAIDFFRAHDVAFRIRRLRLIIRRLSRDWEADPEVPDVALQQARDGIYGVLALYFEREGRERLGPDFAAIAAQVIEDPGLVLDTLAKRRGLKVLDAEAEEQLAAVLADMPPNLRRKVLLTYLGFPFYDVATLPLMRHEGLTEFDPVKVDRISPEDATSIRDGGSAATLRGIEFFNFGAFFSRAYRENDYLWGRLHGAERMVDLLYSTLDEAQTDDVIKSAKRRLFLAILEEEEGRLTCDPELISGVRSEIAERLPH